MKFLERFALVLFANIVLILSILLCIMIFGWVEPTNVGNVISGWIAGETSSKIILGLCILLIALCIRCIFFDKSSAEDGKNKQGVLMQNENGKLMISKETLENIVSSVAKEHKEAQEIITSVELDRENNINVSANIVVTDDSIIKDLSMKLQKEIKDKVKKSTDLDVKEVNIKIKNAVDSKTGNNVSA